MAAEGVHQDPSSSNRTIDNVTVDVSDAYLAMDVSDAYLETAIIAARPANSSRMTTVRGGAYRLLTMVKSDSFRRIVDLVDAIMGL